MDAKGTEGTEGTEEEEASVHGGGIRPRTRCRSPQALTLAEREEVSRGLVCGQSLRQIARGLSRSPSTLSREIRRNGGSNRYRATEANKQAWKRASRPKPCRLLRCPQLRQLVEEKLREDWAPQQIAGWLKRTYPGSESLSCHRKQSIATCLSSPVGVWIKG